jgi:YD repeat-containing protein
VIYTQQWDAENRLTVVTNTNTLSVTRFVYDGDGARVLQIKPEGSQTAYVGGLMETDLTTTVPITPAGWSGRVTRQESGEGVSGVTLTLNKQEACAQNGTLAVTVYWEIGLSLSSASATVYVYDANGIAIGSYPMTLSYNGNLEEWTGATNVSLPAGSYQAYVQGSGQSGKTTVYGYSAAQAFAINGGQTTPATFYLLYSTAPSIGPVSPLPYTGVTTTTTPLTSTVTTATGAYGLYATGITYNGACTNSLRLVETVPANYVAQSASAPSPGTVISATEIQYPAVDGSQNYPSNNFTLSSNTIPTTGAIKKVYYPAGSQLIATPALHQTQCGASVRIITDGGSVLYYLHTDHLGSTSLTTCGTGCGTAGTLIARQLLRSAPEAQRSGV